MKKHFKITLLAVVSLITAGLLSACGGDDSNPAPKPTDEYSKGTFTFCYGANESELDYATFKFKYTFLDENGKEKTEEETVEKSQFTADNPDPTVTASNMRFCKHSVRLYALPGSVKIETTITLKDNALMTADKYDVSQTMFAYFQPDGAKYAQSWSSGTVISYKGVQKDKLTDIFSILQRSASLSFIIQKNGNLTKYK